MKEVTTGGVKIMNFGTKIHEEDCLYSLIPYRYESIFLLENTTFRISYKSVLLFYYEGTGANIKVDGKKKPLEVGDVIFSGEKDFEIEAVKTSLFFIVSSSTFSGNYFELIKKYELKIVSKPWGKETWINHPDQDFSLKEIHINPGTQTSLQYHRFKTETNLVFSGEALLYYKLNDVVKIDEVTLKDLGKLNLSRGDVIHIVPYNLHRLEAITGLTLLEASTTQLDDVIRIHDNFNRDNGRIESEHEK